MSPFDYTDYKVFLREWIENQPRRGWGQVARLAEHLRVSTTLISQVLNSDKHFSSETAAEVTEFLGLNTKESEFFLLLIDYARAGSFRLRAILEAKILRERDLGRELASRLKIDRSMSVDEKMIFYSSWIYSGVRLMSAIPKVDSAKEIATRLNLPVALVQKVVQFLLEKGLCQMRGGKLDFGVMQTHIENDSPFVTKHHQNWRLKGFEKMELRHGEDFFFTGPIALSEDAVAEIRNRLPGIVKDLHDIAGPSRSEAVYCLNIDWFAI